MLRVIKKELILNQTVILVNLVIFGACLTYFSTAEPDLPPQLYAGFASMMMALLPALMVTREDKFNAMMLGCSLPVRRKTIVQARFVLSILLAFLGILGAFLLGTFFPLSHFAPTDLFASGPIMVGFCGITLVLSVLLPFTLRFGMKGIIIFLVCTQVLGVVLLTLTQVTGSNLDRAIIGRIVGFFSHLHETLGELGFNVFMVSCLAALIALSYLISVRTFENREL